MDVLTSGPNEVASPTPDLGPTFGITLIGTCVGLMYVVTEPKPSGGLVEMLLKISYAGCTV